MLDHEMREPLFDFLDEHFGKIRTIEEKVIRDSRADVLGVLDGYIVGFEIKSDHDTYTRLKTQVEDYDRVCDFCYIVVGESHRQHVAEHVPEHWGIIVMSAEDTRLDRGADDNPHADIHEQMKLLWKTEMFQLLDMNGCPKYRSKSRAFLREYLAEHIPEEVLKKQMTDLIFERDYTVFEGQPTIGEKKARKKAVRKRKSAEAGDRKRAHTAHYVGKKRKRKK